MPNSWNKLRIQWEYSHAANVMVDVCGLGPCGYCGASTVYDGQPTEEVHLDAGNQRISVAGRGLLQLRLPAADATRDLPFAEDAGRVDPGLKPSEAEECRFKGAGRCA